MNEFITVENVNKTYKINKRGKGIPGMLANLKNMKKGRLLRM